MFDRAILCILFFLAIPCICYADDNQEYWAITSFSFQLSDTSKMKIKEDFRFRDGDFSEQQNDAFFSYKRTELINCGLGFRQVHKEDSSDEWQRENRPYADLTFKGSICGLPYADRNRVEFREFEDKKDVFRYRNQFKLSWPHNLFDLPLRPYVADEVFVQEESGFNRNRIYTGLVWEVSEKLDIDFFYILQKDDSTHGWNDLSILGFEMIFSL